MWHTDTVFLPETVTAVTKDQCDQLLIRSSYSIDGREYIKLISVKCIFSETIFFFYEHLTFLQTLNLLLCLFQ